MYCLFCIVSLLLYLAGTTTGSTCGDYGPLKTLSAQFGEHLSLLKEITAEHKTCPNDTQMEQLLNNTLSELKLDVMKSNKALSEFSTKLDAMESRMEAKITSRIDELKQNCCCNTAEPLFRSCDEIRQKWPRISSGYYRLVDNKGHIKVVYCHMESLCNSEGGWIRVSHLDMRNSNEKCPQGLRLYMNGTVRACGRPTSSSGSCPGIIFPIAFKYTKVCGKVIGYQKGHPDATLHAPNVDGVILTHGNSRSHLWSFTVSPFELAFNEGKYCPCNSPAGKAPPSYVGNHYFCESGDKDATYSYDVNRLYTDDPLWDGKQCGTEEKGCCNQSPISPPWFYRSLNYFTTDYIEMRLCFDEGTGDEDSPVEQYEIYIK